MKKEVLKLALMGLALGGAISSCQGQGTGGKSDSSMPEHSSCKGQNGCTGKADCTGSSGCKGKNGCTGKADCTGHGENMGKNMQSGADQKAKRENAADKM